MQQLEKMDEFFDARADGYDHHMFTEVENTELLYRETALALSGPPDCALLDLGCGTGLELEGILRRFPRARVTGIDLSDGMLQKLRARFPDRALELIQGSYFEVELGTERFDAAVSVMSLHHFPHETKLALYRRLFAALKPGGVYVEADYTVPTLALEEEFLRENDRLRRAQGIAPDTFYHFDTPFTPKTQETLLLRAGFSNVDIHWACETSTIFRARKIE